MGASSSSSLTVDLELNISVLLLYSVKCWLAASVEDAVASLSVVAIYYSMLTSLTRNALILSGGRGYSLGLGPVCARGRCRISPPRFLAECCKRQLNQGSFILLYFRLFAFSDLY